MFYELLFKLLKVALGTTLTMIVGNTSTYMYVQDPFGTRITYSASSGWNVVVLRRNKCVDNKKWQQAS